MRLTTPPGGARWTHTDARAGFEVVFFKALSAGYLLSGHTTAHESCALWSVGYDVTVDHAWKTVAVHASNVTAEGKGELTLSRDSDGGWTANGEPRPELDGCLDVDFESSAVTNTLPSTVSTSLRESVLTYRQLLSEPMTSVWNVSNSATH